MNCLLRVAEWLGVYEPLLDSREVKRRLEASEEKWQLHQQDRTVFWADFQQHVTEGPNPQVDRAVADLYEKGVRHGVAVDLGCGVSGTALMLLERGWTVYAVDSSPSVLSILLQAAKQKGRADKLVCVESSIEAYQFPKNVSLIIACESLPYVTPTKVIEVFKRAKEALTSPGLFVGNFFPPICNAGDTFLQRMFGAWITTKNVIDAVVKESYFPSATVQYGKSRNGIAKQIHFSCSK